MMAQQTGIEQRGECRRRVEASVSFMGAGFQTMARLTDLSTSGARIEFEGAEPELEEATLLYQVRSHQFFRVRARVVWRRNGTAGLRFDYPSKLLSYVAA